MAPYRLVVGNKNYSSWSMRAWLAARLAGAPFEEHRLWLDADRDRAQRRRYSPTGKVPVLLDGDFAVWDSLAIAEHLAERFPAAGLWPADPRARARARSLCAEMHAGFQALRNQLPMDLRAVRPGRERSPEVNADVERVVQIWTTTRDEFGAGGAYLFGAPSLADAFYAPVAGRFRTYSVPLPPAAAAYRDAVLAWPPVVEWAEAAAAEDHTIEEHPPVT